MPILVLTTNVKIEHVKTFVLDLHKFGQTVLDKPEKYVTVQYHYDEHLTFAGTLDPAFLFTITSLDNINPEVNKIYSATFFEYFKQKLGVVGNRGFIIFGDPGRANIGYEGTTFETIFGPN